VVPHPRDDPVARQYQRWVYPEPITDLPAWLEDNWQWFDPSHAHRLMWPDRMYPPDMAILVAGCGTNQAAILATTNPRAQVVAIDVSQSSLDHHQHLKDTHGLANLELRLLPIEQAGDLDRDFDLIVSTGVLHHLADPLIGARALAALLRPDGVLALMLYARYGRIGVEMLQSVFRDIGLQQDDGALRVIADAMSTLPADHPVRTYLAIAPDLHSDAGVVDTFLHGRDRSYTVDECLELVSSCGLVFQDWFLKAPYYPPVASGSPFHAAITALPVERQWAVMERVNSRNACHFFMACRADRPQASYAVDFASAGFSGYVPSLRHRCSLEGNGISCPGWSAPLDTSQLAILRHVDGGHTIGEALARAVDGGALAHIAPPARTQFARELFQSLWQLDVIAVELRPA
jgi:SAM-dependent methyltransferase